MQLRSIISILFSSQFRLPTTFSLIALLLLCGTIFEKLIPSKVAFERSETPGAISWSSTVPLQRGDYYISVGRAQGPCALHVDGQKLDHNVGTASVSERSAL